MFLTVKCSSDLFTQASNSNPSTSPTLTKPRAKYARMLYTKGGTRVVYGTALSINEELKSNRYLW